MYDVVIIGGGPVGSQVAYQLAGMGYGVVVVEQNEELGAPVCCTGIIGLECVSSFAIDESVVYRRSNSARVFSPSGRLLRLWRPEPQACIVDRAALNMALAHRAQVKGVEYLLNSPVKGISVENDSVRITVDAQGVEFNYLKARAVVLATGFGSKIVDGLGLGKVGDIVIGAQAEVVAPGVDEVEVYLGQDVAPGFFAWLVPTSPQRALVGLLSRRHPEHYLRKLISTLAAQEKIAPSEVEPSYRGVPLKPLLRTFGERLLVVGSAAGQVKPTSGGGIYYGLLCADIAASNLHQALRNDTLSARGLSGYEKEWKRKLEREIRIGYWARKLYERLNDRQVDRIFDIMISNGIDEALLKADDLSFDWHGKAVLKLFGYQALSTVVKAIKLPSLSGGRG